MRNLLARAGAVALIVVAAMAFSSTASAAPAWTSPATLGPIGESGYPDIAVGPDGEAIAAWVGSGRKGVQVSTRRPGRGWSAPITLRRYTPRAQG